MRLYYILLMLLLLIGCREKKPFFFDFEREADLDSLHWKCKTIFSLSNDHATSGKKSLKMELFPSSYPGLTLGKFNPDWSKFSSLKFDIYNPEEKPVRLSIRIDDKQNPVYNDRYNSPINPEPGLNPVSIPLNSLVTSGSKRKLNRARINQVIIFLVNPQEKRVLYLDNLRLE